MAVSSTQKSAAKMGNPQSRASSVSENTRESSTIRAKQETRTGRVINDTVGRHAIALVDNENVPDEHFARLNLHSHALALDVDVEIQSLLLVGLVLWESKRWREKKRAEMNDLEWDI